MVTRPEAGGRGDKDVFAAAGSSGAGAPAPSRLKRQQMLQARRELSVHARTTPFRWRAKTLERRGRRKPARQKLTSSNDWLLTPSKASLPNCYTGLWMLYPPMG
ncbi:uncharacterized protein LOC120885274 [Ictidomys tridecemlineatus]